MFNVHIVILAGMVTVSQDNTSGFPQDLMIVLFLACFIHEITNVS